MGSRNPLEASRPTEPLQTIPLLFTASCSRSTLILHLTQCLFQTLTVFFGLSYCLLFSSILLDSHFVRIVSWCEVRIVGRGKTRLCGKTRHLSKYLEEHTFSCRLVKRSTKIPGEWFEKSVRRRWSRLTLPTLFTLVSPKKRRRTSNRDNWNGEKHLFHLITDLS